jgi:hypothetical protein
MTDAWSLKRALRTAADCWHAFFHASCDTRVCALVRIAFAALVLVNFAVLYPDLDHWFTAGGVLPAEASRETVSPGHWSLFWLLPDTPAAVHTCFWIAVGNAVLLGLGFLPRLNALAVFLWLISFQVRNSLITDGEDDVFKMIAFCLIWIPSGHCWSAGALLRRQRQPEHQSLPTSIDRYAATPAWGLRLLQIEIAMVLFSAGIVKLAGEPWLNGTALYYVARLDDYFGRLPVPDWLFDTPWVIALLTWSVIAVELAVPILIWFRETRRACLLALLLFHLGNEWTMNLFLFHWIMLCGWLAFLTADDLNLLGFGRSLSKAET